MTLVKTLLRISGIFIIMNEVRGDGCTNSPTYEHPVINMCEARNVTLGRVYISITTANMGSSTKCSCTLRARTPGQQTSTTFVLWNVESYVRRCNESLIRIISPENIDITCASKNASQFYTGQMTDDLMILLSRPDTWVGVSYCLFLQPTMPSANGLELVCPSNSLPQSSPPTTVLTTPNSSSPTMSTQSPTTSSSSPSSSTVTVTSSAALSQISSSAGPVGSSSLGPLTSFSSTDGGSSTESAALSVGAVAGGVGGGVAVIIVIVVVVVIIVVVSKRRQGRPKPPGQREPRVEEDASLVEEDLHDPNYSTADVVVATETSRRRSKPSSAVETPSSSQTRSMGGMLAASSNPYELEEDTPQDNGAVIINPTVGSASLTLGTNESQPPKRAGDEYAVVKKPVGKKARKPPPSKPPKPLTLTSSANAADVTTAAAGGDEYAVVDKTRIKGGKTTSDLPSADVTPPPVSPSPGLLYADVEEVRGQGHRSAPPRPPADVATETEYSTIDHVATANLASDA